MKQTRHHPSTAARLAASNISPARKAAYEVLMAVECEGAFASVLLSSVRFDRLGASDRCLLEEIVLGTLRWQGELDWLMQQCSRRDLAALDVEVRVALRAGLYQLAHLQRVPAHAVVNDAAETVKAARKKSAASFVNAVLRRAVNDAPRLLAELSASEDADSLAVRFSHPAWLPEKWVAKFGRDEATAVMQANNERPAEGLRLNPFVAPVEETRERLLRAGVVLEASRLATGGYRVASGPADELRKAVADGSAALQDESSQLAAEMVSAHPGDRVLDLCAAPGGKTAVIAAAMRGQGQIVAGDLYPHRLLTTRRLLLKQRIPNVRLVAWDAQRGLPLNENLRFDRVLVDAPCSGTGTLRRHPEIKWRLTRARIEELAQLQLRLLGEAARWCAGGGRVVYSTCSLEREEDEDVVSAFLSEHPDFAPVQPLSETFPSPPQEYLRTFPHRQGADGFFIACLERR